MGCVGKLNNVTSLIISNDVPFRSESTYGAAPDSTVKTAASTERIISVQWLRYTYTRALGVLPSFVCSCYDVYELSADVVFYSSINSLAPPSKLSTESRQ